MTTSRKARLLRWLLPVALLITTAVYWPGLSGSWLFDDYPNIVDNPGVQPHQVNVPALVRAALSSPASEFKRPLASLSFATNYLISGLNPWSWKLFNLAVHLLNGVLVFLLARLLLLSAPHPTPSPRPKEAPLGHAEEEGRQRAGVVAVLIAAGWMLLPINLTAVLYVVQREESMANLFVLLGLIGYVAGRRRMAHLLPTSLPDQVRNKLCAQGEAQKPDTIDFSPSLARATGRRGGFWLCFISLTVPVVIGVLAKETAVMLPLYALLIEWIVFRFNRHSASLETHRAAGSTDWRIAALFLLALVLPLIIGLVWLLPSVLAPASWTTRDFTLGTRLLSEARIVCDYIAWTLLPTPHALSFYHDQFPISTGLLTPWTTLAGILFLIVLIVLVFRLRRRWPLVALGIALFLGCQLLTCTILPLELVYEHRNYFASFGLLLAVVPWLTAPRSIKSTARGSERAPLSDPPPPAREGIRASSLPFALPRYALLAALLLWWIALTTITAYAWGDPLRLAQELAERAPDSPRAQYELGRTYIIYSHYDPASPYTALAYAPLERAASFPESSILPQQALIFMNSRMHLPLKDAWWDSLIAKLKARPSGVQDDSSLAALAQCAKDRACDLPTNRMVQAFDAALSHPRPGARLQATYGDYAWNVLDEHALGERMIEAAVKSAPDEPAYRITLVRMLVALGRKGAIAPQMQALQRMNIGGRLDGSIRDLQQQIDALKTLETLTPTP